MSHLAQPPQRRSGRLIVTYRDGIDSESARAANAAVGARMLRPMAIAGVAVVVLPPEVDVAQALATLQRQHGVLAAEPDGQVFPSG